jgi:methylglyoxal reductase
LIPKPEETVLMQRRRLPGTDLDLSVVGLGCWAMGGLWWGDDVRDEDSVAAVHAALDEGVNWFDTAPLYGHGHADEVLVRALGERRREVLIATKVGVRWSGEGRHAQSDLRPAYLREDTEASLRRLGLERVGLMQVHWPCELGTPLDDSLGELHRLKEEGKIAHFGLCNYSPAELQRARELAPIASFQTPYSMVRRELESGLLQMCREPGGHPDHTAELGVLAYEPLCRGLLSGRFRGITNFPKSDLRARDDRFKGQRCLGILTMVRTLEKIARRVGVPVAALAVGWVCSRPGVTSAIVGAKRPEQLRENAMAAKLLKHEKLWRVVHKVVSGYTG